MPILQYNMVWIDVVIIFTLVTVTDINAQKCISQTKSAQVQKPQVVGVDEVEYNRMCLVS